MFSEWTQQERESAERRIEEIKGLIQAQLAGDIPLKERVARCEALLAESLGLQQLLDGENWFQPQR